LKTGFHGVRFAQVFKAAGLVQASWPAKLSPDNNHFNPYNSPTKKSSRLGGLAWGNWGADSN
jgi:hypothetical protein